MWHNNEFFCSYLSLVSPSPFQTKAKIRRVATSIWLWCCVISLVCLRSQWKFHTQNNGNERRSCFILLTQYREGPDHKGLLPTLFGLEDTVTYSGPKKVVVWKPNKKQNPFTERAWFVIESLGWMNERSHWKGWAPKGQGERGLGYACKIKEEQEGQI